MPVRPSAFRPRGVSVEGAPAVERRGSARSRGYSSAWDRASAQHRRDHPLCAYCALQDLITPCAATDHLYPHLTYAGVFWWSELWVSTCQPCHNGFKQRLELQGRVALDQLARQLNLPTLADAIAARG